MDKPLDGYDMTEKEVRNETKIKEDMIGNDEAYEIITAELDILTKDFHQFVEANNKVIFNKYFRVANRTRDALLGAAYEYANLNGMPLEIMIPVVDKIASNKKYEFDVEEMMDMFGYKTAAPQKRIEIYDSTNKNIAPFGYSYSEDYESGSPIDKADLDTTIDGYEGELTIPGDYAYSLIEENLEDKLNVSEYDWFTVVPENDDGEGWGQIFGIKKQDNVTASIPMREEQVQQAYMAGTSMPIDRDQSVQDTDEDDEMAKQYEHGYNPRTPLKNRKDKMVSLI